MKVTISESQFIRMVNNSKGWGLIGINEDRQKYSPEKEDDEIERIIDDVKRTGEFIFDNKNPDYMWLYGKTRTKDINKKEKFENELNKIRELQVIIGKRREWWGEKTTKQILEQMGFTNIPPLGQHRIDDCRSSLTCKPYKFDVYLPYTEDNEKIYEIITKNENGVLPKTGIIFEYDGEQHFRPIHFYGGDEKFIARIHNDREKNSYCKNKNIKLVRIPYTSKTRDDIKRDIVSALKDPNNFILTGDYPKLGWNK